MLVAIGKGIELDVDVTRFNSEVHDHIVRTGLRNLLMDAHASATAKADPEGYVTKSRELAEKKPASLYAGIIGVQSVGPARHPQACQAIQCWHWHRPPHGQARRRAARWNGSSLRN